jgi:hypothetical protein
MNHTAGLPSGDIQYLWCAFDDLIPVFGSSCAASLLLILVLRLSGCPGKFCFRMLVTGGQLPNVFFFAWRQEPTRWMGCWQIHHDNDGMLDGMMAKCKKLIDGKMDRIMNFLTILES